MVSVCINYVCFIHIQHTAVGEFLHYVVQLIQGRRCISLLVGGKVGTHLLHSSHHHIADQLIHPHLQLIKADNIHAYLLSEIGRVS